MKVNKYQESDFYQTQKLMNIRKKILYTKTQKVWNSDRDILKKIKKEKNFKRKWNWVFSLQDVIVEKEFINIK